MLKKYKNQLLWIIQNSKLEPEQFAVEEKEIEHPLDGVLMPSFTLFYVNTPFYFRVWDRPDDFHLFDCVFTTFAPNFPDTYLPDDEYMLFVELSSAFRFWLSEHIEEFLEDQITPDLWSQIKSQGALINWTPDSKLADFNEFEKREIRKSIDHVKKLIIEEFSLKTEEIEEVNSRLDYLSNALDRLNKTDWKGILASTIISISIALSLDTEKGKVLFELFKEAFNKILYLLP